MKFGHCLSTPQEASSGVLLPRDQRNLEIYRFWKALPSLATLTMSQDRLTGEASRSQNMLMLYCPSEPAWRLQNKMAVSYL